MKIEARAKKLDCHDITLSTEDKNHLLPLGEFIHHSSWHGFARLISRNGQEFIITTSLPSENFLFNLIGMPDSEQEISIVSLSAGLRKRFNEWKDFIENPPED